MTPRDFINFFKTKSGKLVVFALLFGGGLVLFGTRMCTMPANS